MTINPFERVSEEPPQESVEPSVPQKPKPKSTSLRKTLLATGALHAGLAGAIYAGPEVKHAAERITQEIKDYAEPKIEQWRISRERSHMLEEAHEAQEQHRAWAGRFLIHRWFLEKRAAHEVYTDERDIQRIYDQGLASLRHELEGKPPTPQNIQHAFHQVLSRFHYWGGDGEGDIVDFLREGGGNCAMAGPLAAAYLEDLGISGGGIRIIMANPQDEVPMGHVEATLTVQTENGATYDHGLQRGHRMRTNGIHVCSRDLLDFYHPGSIGLHFPAARTEDERRPDPPNSATLTPFGEISYADFSDTQAAEQRRASGGQMNEAAEAGSREGASLTYEIHTYILNARILIGIQQRPYLGDTQFEAPSSELVPVEILPPKTERSWLNHTSRVHALTRLVQEVKASSDQSTQRQRLAAIYAVLSEVHEFMRLQAALERKNTASRRFANQRDRFLQESRSHLPHHLSLNRLNREEVAVRLRSSTDAARVFLSDLQAAWQVANTIDTREDVLTSLILLLQNAPDRTLRQETLAWTRHIIEDPFMRSFFFRELIDVSWLPPADALGRTPLEQQWVMTNNFYNRINAVYLRNNLRNISSANQLEQQLWTKFVLQFPHETYDASYFFTYFTRITTNFRILDPRNFPQGDYAEALRERLADAQESLRVVRLYEHDTRFPAGYISQQIQRGTDIIPQLQHAAEQAERNGQRNNTGSRAGTTTIGQRQR